MHVTTWTRGTWGLVVLFALTEAAANWLAATHKLAVGLFLIPAGAFLIPVSLLLRDGLHVWHPRSAIWAALGVGAVASALFSLSVARVAMASTVAFTIAFGVDMWVFGRLKKYDLPTRMRASNWFSLPVDTVVFVPLAFAGQFPLGALILGQVVAKILMTEVAVGAFWVYQQRQVRRELEQMRQALTESTRPWQ